MGVRALPSGRHQARFIYEGREYKATLDSRSAADEWCKRTRRALVAGTYVDPETGRAPGDTTPLLSEYAQRWIAERRLKPRTRSQYVKMAEQFGRLADIPVNRITRDDVRAWHQSLNVGPTSKQRLYELLRAVMNGAVDDDLIPVSPVRIRGAAKSAPRPMPVLPTPAQVHQMADAMPSAKYRLMVLVSAWCGLRFGETTELRRKDVMLDATGLPTSLRIRRAVTRADGQYLTDTPSRTLATASSRSRHTSGRLPGRPPCWPERDAVSGQSHRHAHGSQQPLQGLVPGAGGRRPATPALARPAGTSARRWRLRTGPTWQS